METPKNLNLYIHIPYCKARCRYCNFYVVAGRTPHLPLYFKALKKELESYGDLSKYKINTIYFGGGTPSLVDAASIKDFINFIKDNYNIDKDLDISLEANPENISAQKLEEYYLAGIRRLSIGLQSWQNNILKYLGRLYTIEEFLEYYTIVKKSPIKNINIDLIFGIPNQTFEDWKSSVDNVINLNPSHISCYSLEVDERSIYGVMEQKGLFKRGDEDLDRKMYKYACSALQKAGFIHYEISNFAKPNFESKHNLAIWNGEEYIGLGASAHSYFKNTRFNNVYDIDKYVLLNLKGKNSKEEIIQIDENQRILEYILLQLRLIKGLSYKNFKDKFGFNFKQKYSEVIERLSNKKLIINSSTHLILSEKGLDLESSVISEFL